MKQKEREVNYKNVRYGMLVEVITDSGYHSGCKVHFYNKKGVLIGNYYQFMPYEKLRMRIEPKFRYQRFFYQKKFEKLKNKLFIIPLRIVDILIRITQPVLD
ncbi:MAG: hypothetical protein KBD57_05950 [Bacteroidia bacterium]|nr:hypothetical protein [Bacteroidia bacterium]